MLYVVAFVQELDAAILFQITVCLLEGEAMLAGKFGNDDYDIFYLVFDVHDNQ